MVLILLHDTMVCDDAKSIILNVDVIKYTTVKCLCFDLFRFYGVLFFLLYIANRISLCYTTGYEDPRCPVERYNMANVSNTQLKRIPVAQWQAYLDTRKAFENANCSNNFKVLTHTMKLQRFSITC